MKKGIILLGVALLLCFIVFMSCDHEQTPVKAPTATQDEVYVPPEDICRDLIAGQYDHVGTVCVSFTSECMNVTYTITTEGILLNEVHLWVDDDPTTLRCAGGNVFDPDNCDDCNPPPGQFPYSHTGLSTTTYTLCVPLSDLDEMYTGSPEDCDPLHLYLVAHALLSNGETGFAEGVACNFGSPGRWYFWDDFTMYCRLNPPTVECVGSTDHSVTVRVTRAPGSVATGAYVNDVLYQLDENGQVEVEIDGACGSEVTITAYVVAENHTPSASVTTTCYTAYCAPIIECTGSTTTTITFTVTSSGGAVPSVVWVSVDGEDPIAHNLVDGSVTIETGDLTCGQSYVITAYFEASNGYAQSSTTTNSCSTSNCEGGCTYTFGYWKTHYPGGWPLAVQQNGLTINVIHYTAVQLWNVLKATPKGNAVTILGHQLIGALLNQWNGAAPPEPTGELGCTMQDVYDALGSYNLTNGSVLNKSNPTQFAIMIAAAACLDDYNNGRLNVPHCPTSNPVCGRCLWGPPNCRTCSDEICTALSGQWTQGQDCPLWQHEH
jgi:hypothetical protein